MARDWREFLSKLEGPLILERKTKEGHLQHLEISKISGLFELIESDEALARILKINHQNLSDPSLTSQEGKSAVIQVDSSIPLPLTLHDFYQSYLAAYEVLPKTNTAPTVSYKKSLKEILDEEETFLQDLPTVPRKTKTSFNPYEDVTVNDLEKRKINNAFCVETQGARATQEDAYGCVSFPIGIRQTQLNEEDLARIMFSAIVVLERKLEKNKEINHKKIGSTLTASLQYKNHLVTANVGDSRTLLITESPDAKNKKYTVKARTWDHKPDTERELQRIYADGGHVFHKPHNVPRLNGSLAMSRSIGDTRLRGNRHKPTLTCDNLTQSLKEKNNSYILHFCDGLSDTLSDKEIEDFINQSTASGHTLENTVTSLLKYAAQSTCVIDKYIVDEKEVERKGSADNITVLLVPANKNPDDVTLSFVADGHGGNAVSNYITKNLPSIVQRMTKKLQEEKLKKLSIAEKPKNLAASSASSSSSEEETEHKPQPPF